MTDKSMPERIYVWTSGIQINCSRSYQPGDAEYIRADLVPAAAVMPVIQKGCFTVVGDLLDYELTAVIAAYEATGIAAWTEGDIYNDKYAVGFQKINIDTDHGQGAFDTAIVLSCVSKDEVEELLSCECEMKEVLVEDIIAALPQLLTNKNQAP